MKVIQGKIDETILRVFLVLLFASVATMARGGEGKAGTVKGDPAPVAAVPAATMAASAMPATSLEQVLQLLQSQAQELADLRASLREQQELTAKLMAKLNSPAAEAPANSATSTAQPAAGAAIPQAEPVERVAKVEAEVASSRKSVEERIKSLGPFSFSGDIRLRAEPTFGGPSDQSQDRLRERIRLRFNVEARLNDQLKGGFSLASGDLNDPISTNQTAGQYATRKPIEIDRAYATYNPKWFRPLTLTAGKFAYPWFNTELVWDKDLNPEGAAEMLAFPIQTPLLKKVAVVAFQSPFAENRRTAADNKSFYNTMVYGEQLQTFWQLGRRVKLNAYAGYYKWKYADSIAFSLATANSASPDNGLLPLRSSGVQNSIGTVTATNPATGAKTITSAQFASKFGILDALTQVEIQTPKERWPVTLVGDFAQNTQACANAKNIPAGAIFSAPCDPHTRRAYWLEARVGRTDRRGDWQFAYTRFVIGRESIIGAFNYSEIFPENNVEFHRPEILYQLFRNVTLQVNALIGRPLVSAGSPPPAQPLWERFQFDVTYKF